MNKTGTTKEKLARIRYHAEGKDPKQNVDDIEGFILEIWDNQYNEWELVTKVQSRKSTDFPEVDEKDYIHWEFLVEISRLSEMGYKITM